MSITIYPSQFNMREDGSYAQLPAIKGETGEQGVPGVGALPGGTKGQVPVKQSTDDYDVAWEDIGWKLVWENASPTSAFAAQTIPLDLSGYEMFLIQIPESVGGTYSDLCFSVIAFKGRNMAARVTPVNASARMYVAMRQFTVSDTGIDFSACIESTISSTNTDSQSANVPIKIWAK